MKLKVGMSIVIIGLACSFADISHAIDLKGCYKEQFKITGYYSPEKSQDFYAKANFEDEKILNGDGTHGASGKAVFNGMIAAPKIYDFGTKIYLPGFGVGSVDDRGGAIVEKGEKGEKYHRIDIWMGKGEEALQRAISFGVVYKEGWVCPAKSSLNIGFDMKKFTILQNFFQNTLWRVQLGQGRNDPWVGVLQGYLKKLGYFKSEVNNNFGTSTKNALCNFQNTVLGLKKTDFWCGYFGTSARNGLKYHLEKKGMLNGTIEVAKVAKVEKAIKVAKESDSGPKEQVTEVIYIAPKSKVESTKSKELEKNTVILSATKGNEVKSKNLIADAKNQRYLQIGDTRNYQFWNDIPFGTKSMEVKLLQRKLQWMGYYKKQISGIYDDATKVAIFQFQVDKKILKYDDMSISKGWLGPKTRELLNKVK